MKAKLAIVGVFLVAIVAIVFLKAKGADSAAGGSTAASGSASSAVPPVAVEISMLYSTEKKDWVEDAAVAFRREHPEIKLTLTGKGSLEAAQAILDEKEKPAIFSPADTLVLNLFESDYKTKFRTDPFATSGDDGRQLLVITPLVFVVWEDRAAALLKAGGAGATVIGWKSIHQAIVSNKGWPSVGGKTEWGFVKLGHTDPTKSNSGMQALVLMSYEYFGKTSGLEVGDVLKPDYQTFIRETEKGVAKFEASTGTFMTDMIRFGPSVYDISAVYENLAISQIENAQGRWGNLKVYYPATTLWSDHPVVLMNANVDDKQRAAARLWIAHLRSRPVQERALTFGFRPGDTSVPVKTADAQNPFTRLAQYGVRLDIPPVAKVPDGAVIRNMLTMWTRVVAEPRR